MILEKPRIFLAMPVHGMVPSQTMMSMVKLHSLDHRSSRFLRCTKTVGMSIVHWARNELVREFLLYRDSDGKPCTHLMFIDADMEFPPDGMLKLAEADKDIISGLCTNRKTPVRAEIRRRQEDGQYQLIGDLPEDMESLEAEPLLEVDATGMAFTLIKRAVLEKLAEPWFECKKIEGAPRYSEYGEDIYFCQKAKAAGFSVFARVDCIIGHVGTYAYDINDAWATNRAMRARESMEADGDKSGNPGASSP